MRMLKTFLFIAVLTFSGAAFAEFDDMGEAQARADFKEWEESKLGEEIRTANDFTDTLTVKLVKADVGSSGRSQNYYYVRLQTALKAKTNGPEGEKTFLSDSLLQPNGKNWTEFSIKPWKNNYSHTISPLSVGIGQAYKKSGKSSSLEYSYAVCLMYGYREQLLACEHVSLADVAKSSVSTVTIKIAKTGEQAVVELSP
jgi:hypothetical protein